MQTDTPHYDYDAVIVGSGFGGSVMAYRLAAAGLRVCVMERGKAYPPGSFARSPWRMRTNFWDPSEGLHGLFNIWSFNGLSAVVSSGLGGGSLIYANVLLRKEKETFRDEGWPVSYEDLEPHYTNAERMLSAQPYPFQEDPAKRTPDRDAYNQTAKTEAMRIAALRLKKEGQDVAFKLPNLAVTFANPGKAPVPGQPIHGTGPEGEGVTAWDPSQGPIPSMFGRTRLTCVMCGQCDVGCNIGSKNTLDHTYLSAAILQPGPATIMTRTEVKEMEPHNGGYRVRYVDHRFVEELVQREPGKKPELHTVTSRYLILSAGALGSTFLLLKNRDRFPKLVREALGTRFCGNGDLLSFVQKCLDDEQAPRTPRVLDTGYGPVITSALQFRDSDNGKPNGYYYIEDAGYPEAVNWMLELTTPLSTIKRGARLGWRLARGWLRIEPDADIGAEFASFLGDTVLSKSSMPLLAMGRDTPDGKMTIQPNGLLDIDWKIKGSGAYFRRVRSSAKDIARVLGGRFRDNPLTLLSRVITVHPLGGCPMDGADWKGVVDSYGRVHGYEGFVIADGSVVPGPVGPNPSLTIAALADRFADQLIAQHRATAAGSGRNPAMGHPESSTAETGQPIYRALQ